MTDKFYPYQKNRDTVCPSLTPISDNFIRPKKRVLNMTLVQASIADRGKCVILVADRLLTATLSEDLPKYETEGDNAKTINRGCVGVGFAGSFLYADMCTSRISTKRDFDKIVETISSFVKETKNEVVDSFIKKHVGVEPKEFFKNPNLPIPKEVRNFIYGRLKDLEIACTSLVAGFDKKGKARIIIVNRDGRIIETTNYSAIAIGSGSPFSKIYFDQYNYNSDMSTDEALLFAYEAKQWAQAHTGVGIKTDILIFRKGKKALEILDESKLMQELHKRYEKEYRRHSEIRKTLLKGILK